MEKEAFIGLGTNLGNREENLKKAIDKINMDAGEVVSISLKYKTEPWGFKSKDHFLNMVVRIKTSLEPVDLLKQLLKIEMEAGRIRGTEKYSSRIIDIDLLLYGNEIINKPYLKVPHPLIQERKFVLVPLCDVAAEMIHPVLKKTFAELLKDCRDKSVVQKMKSFNHGF
ncbi:MAG TPA: 2-amino-4-hydroxy-6-hydroxymethyldihydropteridine diphosphokinase [Bacteroidales bacterium]|nr:2-amino-4-hydroxy-6-hydroxymethyldihydropteridine diphosphokinase [Bacteroidales bacterium]